MSRRFRREVDSATLSGVNVGEALRAATLAHQLSFTAHAIDEAAADVIDAELDVIGAIVTRRFRLLREQPAPPTRSPRIIIRCEARAIVDVVIAVDPVGFVVVTMYLAFA